MLNDKMITNFEIASQVKTFLLYFFSIIILLGS